MQSEIDITPSNTLYYWREVIWIYGKTRNFISHFMFKKQSTKVINMMVVCVVVLVRLLALRCRFERYENMQIGQCGDDRLLNNSHPTMLHLFIFLISYHSMINCWNNYRIKYRLIDWSWKSAFHFITISEYFDWVNYVHDLIAMKVAGTTPSSVIIEPVRLLQ